MCEIVPTHSPSIDTRGTTCRRAVMSGLICSVVLGPVLPHSYNIYLISLVVVVARSIPGVLATLLGAENPTTSLGSTGNTVPVTRTDVVK